MIYRDDNGYPQSINDGMDSCVRASILTMYGQICSTKIANYVKGFLGVRHPTEVPANNPWNFTKDQLKMLIAGLIKAGRHDLVRKLFWSHLLRLGFCQNFQRDYSGSWKFPWPHWTQDYNFKDGTLKGDPKTKVFDGPDWLFPNDWACLIVGGRLWLFYPLLLIGYLAHLIALTVNAGGSREEQCQMIAECLVLGTLRPYRKITRNWQARSAMYWGRRGEIEYHEILVKVADGPSPKIC